jgi:mono/diheme cytochrome c family protein
MNDRYLLLGLLLVGTLLGTTLGGQTPNPVITPVTGPSWLRHLGISGTESSLGRGSGVYGPPPDAAAAPGLSKPVPIRESMMLSGSDLYRLNCQACHRETGSGRPPEIKTVLTLVQGSSLEAVREQLRKSGLESTAAARALADKARADLYRRIQQGGQRMPPLAHLQGADVDALYAFLTQLAHVPDAQPAQQVRVSRERLGEHVVKGTCHICHDAVGSRPTGGAQLRGSIPALNVLLEENSVVAFMQKVRRGMPVTMGDVPFHYRGRMPVFGYLQDEEIAAAYAFLEGYPPRAQSTRGR